MVLVEDIVDTGITTTTALEYLKSYQPASLKLCALLDKPARRQVQVTIDYLGLTVPDRLIVGYGIDFDQKYRQLPAIYTIES
ncbi:MAG: phosphoribosyltransferase [Aulosira sp. ZfuVER01]|nr:phosphoribosyltransferase family protein [Aulosira sp. ZfuVER01]MDZ8000266.1 phosphoribosyltransferase family protein [Aulosira sp. DedVER01a]MDZ8053366.1 phosphoribosyltransferase family protein [Aulosira sp. ZfuCHP01]